MLEPYRPYREELVAVGVESTYNWYHVVLNWFEELKRLVPTDN